MMVFQDLLEQQVIQELLDSQVLQAHQEEMVMMAMMDNQDDQAMMDSQDQQVSQEHQDNVVLKDRLGPQDQLELLGQLVPALVVMLLAVKHFDVTSRQYNPLSSLFFTIVNSQLYVNQILLNKVSAPDVITPFSALGLYPFFI